jgi:TonB family protein
LCAAFWFYPPAWWLARKLREAAEMACDEEVLRARVPADAYRAALARTLGLGLARDGSVLAAPGILGTRPSSFRRRWERIRSDRRARTMWYHRLAIVLAFATAVGVSTVPWLASDAGALGLADLREADLPVQLKFRGTRVADVLDSLSAASGVRFEIEGDLSDRHVDVETERIPLSEALARLGSAGRLGYVVLDPDTVEVRALDAAMAGADGVTMPRLISASKVQPVYPEAAMAERAEAKVILHAIIRRDGTVGDLQVLRSQSPEGLRDAFGTSAIEAVRQWRYEPALRDGEPVDVYFTIVVEFSMSHEPKP